MGKEFVQLGVERLEQRDNPSSGWSFWDDTYLGAVISGVGQGVLNTVNGVQDAVIGVANLPVMFYNNTIGNLGGGTIRYISSPVLVDAALGQSIILTGEFGSGVIKP